MVKLVTECIYIEENNSYRLYIAGFIQNLCDQKNDMEKTFRYMYVYQKDFFLVKTSFFPPRVNFKNKDWLDVNKVVPY